MAVLLPQLLFIYVYFAKY